MEDSILKSTKKILGIADDYTPFDLDILTHINSAFSITSQVGITESGFYVLDDTATWTDLDLPQDFLGLLRTYIFLNVRMLFDPPTLSFLLDKMQQQLDEHLIRLSYFRENLIPSGTIPVLVGPPGPTGPAGPPGTPAGGSFSYVHDQTSPSSTWVIVHNLNGYPNITTVDSGGNELHGGVDYDSLNQITVTFSSPQTGKAYLS